MKKTIASLLFIFCYSLTTYSQSTISFQKTIKVTNNSFINAGTKYNLNDEQSIYDFLNNVVFGTLSGNDKTMITAFTNLGLENSAIIFLRHDFDPTDWSNNTPP